MENSSSGNGVDFIGANIKTFNSSDNINKEDHWCWPPPQDVMTIMDQYLESCPSNQIITCFNFDQIPFPVSDSSGSSKYSLAAHCFIYSPTNDLRKGCAMVKIFIKIQKFI